MGLGRRWAMARLNGRRVVGATIALAVGVGVSTAVTLLVRFGWQLGPQTATIATIYAAGAGLGFAAAVVLVNLSAPRAGVRLRATLTGLLAVVAILAAALGLFVLEHRVYYSQWHGPAFSRVWIWQQAFTAFGATAQFAVMGVRYFGLPTLVLVALATWWAHRPDD